MDLDDLDRNKIIYQDGSLTFRELSEENGKDKTDIVEIIKQCAIKSTAVLYTYFFLNSNEIEEEINKKHQHLKCLLYRFKEMKNDFPFSKKPPESGEQFNKIWEHIKEELSAKKLSFKELFATFWPIQFPFKENTVKYIQDAIEAHNDKPKGKRKLFRLGIEYEKELIGCFEFDYIEKRIDGKKTIGNLGIFIDPEFRNKKNEKREPIYSWHDIFSGGVLLLEKFIKKPVPDDLYISASMHPLNTEAKSHILTEEKGFFRKESKKGFKYKMQERDCYLCEYGVFIKNFKK